jgi:hypothetical protein
MDGIGAVDPPYGSVSHSEMVRRPTRVFSSWSLGGLLETTTRQFAVEVTIVFLAYIVAGKLGQATTNIRSSNLGPVWPAYGIALAAFLAYGYRVWPGSY